MIEVQLWQSPSKQSRPTGQRTKKARFDAETHTRQIISISHGIAEMGNQEIKGGTAESRISTTSQKDQRAEPK